MVSTLPTSVADVGGAEAEIDLGGDVVDGPKVVIGGAAMAEVAGYAGVAPRRLELASAGQKAHRSGRRSRSCMNLPFQVSSGSQMRKAICEEI